MPTLTTRNNVLAYFLKCFFALQVASLATTYYQTHMNPNNFTTILACLIVLDQLDLD